ncbi:MEMO1 family [Suillus cothurnatus]|nr:MEMO1 family [Suillus cothurnatus]
MSLKSRPAVFSTKFWYSADGDTLDAELSNWLADVKPTDEDDYAPPVPGCKAIIAPHAGYSYSGPAAAWAYKSISTAGISRVFILGPSHAFYLSGCALSKCETYETPLGNLTLDREVIEELYKTQQFEYLQPRREQGEHSIEMHLPYVYKVFEGCIDNIKIVPIMVGAIDQEQEQEYGKILAPYLERDDTLFVISSDFCHWGHSNYGYTFYYPKTLPSDVPGVNLRRSGPRPSPSRPIHTSISDLDHEAMDILTQQPASTAHGKFAAYLERTHNTICGRHPIGVLMGALGMLEEKGKQAKMKWVRYEQSNQCMSFDDWSVSYASAYVTF